MLKPTLFMAAIALAIGGSAVAEPKLEPPVAVRTVTPEYPAVLKRDGVNGIVVVRCTVDEQGNVASIEVQKSTNAEFDKPALEAVKKWKFKPAKVDGSPVAKKVSIPIKFVAES